MSTYPELPFFLPPQPIPLGCPRAPALSALLHALNLHWSSILHVVIYMFQCYSLISSYPHLLPRSPKICSLHLCLFCCHSDILAWEIPSTERNLLGYSPWGCKRAGHNLMTKQLHGGGVFKEKLFHLPNLYLFGYHHIP